MLLVAVRRARVGDTHGARVAFAAVGVPWAFFWLLAGLDAQRPDLLRLPAVLLMVSLSYLGLLRLAARGHMQRAKHSAGGAGQGGSGTAVHCPTGERSRVAYDWPAPQRGPERPVRW